MLVSGQGGMSRVCRESIVCYREYIVIMSWVYL